MKKSRILSIFLFWGCPLLGWGNGGPIDGSAMYRTGNVVPMQKSGIQLVREDLKINIIGNYAYFDVTYVLSNQTDLDESIKYGFPIDIDKNNTFTEGKTLLDRRYIPQISFRLDSTDLAIINTVKDKKTIKLETSSEMGSFAELQRYWYIVDFVIPKMETKKLYVKYKILCNWEDWETNKSVYPSFGDRSFSYDFGPAKYWGNGEIGELAVSIDPRFIYKNHGRIDIKGLILKKTSGIFQRTYEKFKIQQAENLVVSFYHNDIPRDYLKKNIVRLKDVKNIKASSTLSGRYSARNLFDMNMHSVWAEGVSGDGAGESISFELKDVPVYKIWIVNGNRNSPAAFADNGVVTSITCDITYVRKKNSAKEFNYTKMISEESLIRQVYTRKDDIYQMMSILLRPDDVPYPDYSEDETGFYVRKIILTINKVDKGKKYDDTCITDLLIEKMQEW